MKYHLDSILGEDRLRSVKYRFLSRVFDPRMIPLEYAWEISVLLATPGFSVANVCSMMLWHPGFYGKCVVPLICPESLAEVGRDNLATVTRDDAINVLLAVLRGRERGFGRMGDVPVVASMWLQEEWRSGRSLRAIAAELGVHEATLGRGKEFR